MATNEQVNLDLTATDKASKKVDALADKVDDLEAHPAEVEVAADTSSATKSLADLTGEAKRLAGQKWIVDLKADMDKALTDAHALESQLKALESNDIDIDTSKAERHLSDLDRKTDGSGTNITNTFRDLGGPLGEMTSTVGDFGEAFQTAGEQAGATFGLSGTATRAMTAGLGVIGLAVGGLTYLWNQVKAAQEKANERATDYLKALEAANGELDKARQAKLGESLTEADFRRLHDYHLTLADLTAMMDGKTTPATERYRQAVLDAQLAAAGYTDGVKGQTDANRKIVADHEKITRLIGDEDSALRKANDTYRAKQAVLGDTTAATQRQRDKLQDLNTTLDGYNSRLADIPPAKHTDVAVSDNGTAAATKARIDQIPAHKTSEVSVKLTGDINDPRMAFLARQSVTNVTINAPAGVRGAELVAAADRHARRNGGRGARS